MMEKKSGKSKKGILFLILGTLAVIAGVMIFAVVTGRVTADADTLLAGGISPREGDTIFIFSNSGSKYNCINITF